ncbi:hypothetical protein [Oceanobacillus picturae]|uniref:hypothetical protein n=1 Tax=Oceanobacillus picturae TaxID=171693 RepID=UPI000E694B3E|nr:hypothetical protein [Oceanobacillus picturae]RIU94734.1 hypothetical protein D1864_02915 [Oceanobacillus picturae]
MKTFVLTTASALLLTSVGVGYAWHANPDKTQVSENDTEMIQQKAQVDTENMDDFLEYDTLDDVADVDHFNSEVVEDNPHKRIILLKDDNAQPQFKSIFVKDTNRLKIINLHEGLEYNEIIQ